MRVFADIDEMAAAIEDGGVDLGHSEWLTVDQRMIDLFAEATGDHQWIHVDPERAKGGPFGTTIAHGFLTLSLLPRLLGELYSVERAGMVVNVGSDKVRFLAPVPVNSRLRAHAIIERTERRDGAIRNFTKTTIQIEGSEKPAAIVDGVSQVFGVPS